MACGVPEMCSRGCSLIEHIDLLTSMEDTLWRVEQYGQNVRVLLFVFLKYLIYIYVFISGT